MGVNMMHHVLVCCEDLDKSEEFYKNTLGFNKISCELDKQEEDPDSAEALKIPTGEESRLRMLDVNGDDLAMMELVNVMRAGDETDATNPLANPGMKVHCFLVPNLDKTFAELQGAGFQFFMPPREADVPNIGKRKVAIAMSADGVLTELLEMHPES